MNTGVRRAIGAVMVAATAFCVACGLVLCDPLSAGAAIFYALALFCFTGVLACFAPRTRPITIRIIGAVICGACGVALYVLDHSTIPILSAAALGAYIGVTGRYPSWGKMAEVFTTNEHNSH